MLKLWYQGSTTPEQEEALYDYFTHSNHIPDDLKAESIIFGRNSDTMPTSAPEIDPSLLEEIDRAIMNDADYAEDTHVPQPTKMATPVRRFFRAAVSITAAAIAVFAVITYTSRVDNTTLNTSQSTDMAHVDTANHNRDQITPTTPSERQDTNRHETLTEEKPTGNNGHITPPRPNRNYLAQAQSETQSKDITPDGYIIIDSPEEAERIMSESFALIDRALAKSTSSVAKTEQVISSSSKKIIEAFSII